MGAGTRPWRGHSRLLLGDDHGELLARIEKLVGRPAVRCTREHHRERALIERCRDDVQQVGARLLVADEGAHATRVQALLQLRRLLHRLAKT